MNFRPRVTGRSLEYKLNRTGARTEPCVIVHVHPETSISKQQAQQPGEPICHAFTQFVKKASVPDCHMLLLSPERRRQSLGSAGIHFRWKWWGQHATCNIKTNIPIFAEREKYSILTPPVVALTVGFSSRAYTPSYPCYFSFPLAVKSGQYCDWTTVCHRLPVCGVLWNVA